MDSDPGLNLLAFQVVIQADTGNLPLLITMFLTLLACSGLISASEVGFFSLGLNEVKELEDENSSLTNRILSLKERPRHLLATILIANNFVNIAIVIVAEQILRIILGERRLLEWGQWLHDHLLYGISTPQTLANVFNFLITVVGVTFILVLFGEAMPKIYATINKRKVLNIMAWPLSFLVYILSPLTNILVGWSSSMERKLASTSSQNLTSKEDIDAAIDLTVTNTGESSTQEADILKGIVNFGDISARQIMHPRMDVVALEETAGFKEVMKTVRESGYSRLPVYGEDLDKIVGILYVKDLLGFSEEGDDFNWQKLIRKSVLFVPEAKKIDELLREFQLKRVHMAVIVDEFGGTAGIATLEDIMEEVVGDIKDEFDQDEELDYIKISDNNYILEGKTLLNDVCRIIGENTGFFDEEKGDADSLAGLILEVIGSIPSSEKEINIGHLTLKVISVTRRRIEKVSIVINEK